MKVYHFWKTFIQYGSYLLVLLIILFVSIILVFSFNVNREINETAQAQTDSVKHALTHQDSVNQGHHYFIVKNQKVTENHTPFKTQMLKQRFVGQVKQPHVDESKTGIFDVRTVKLSEQRTLYSLTDVKDFHETKQLLVRELSIGFIFAFVLMIAMAFYFARRPVKVYEQLMQEQQTFIQNASHEMKTPVGSLLLGTQYLDMLEQNHLSQEGKETLAQMKSETKYLQQLVNTMMLETLQTDDLKPINLSQSFDETIRTVEMVHQTTIHKLYKPDLMFAIHPLHARQLLNILLENAYHHNDEHVQVRVSAFQTMNGVQIEVSDDGKGIEEAEQDKIFQRFYRVNQETRGSGIGLSLLRQIVSQYDGTIEVKSKLGKGTNFIIKL